MSMKKSYSSAEKAKIALEAIKGERTINEISHRYGVHSTQINQWKKQLIRALPDVFSQHQAQKDGEQQVLMDRLYQQIGQLTVERDFLKKKSELFH